LLLSCKDRCQALSVEGNVSKHFEEKLCFKDDEVPGKMKHMTLFSLWHNNGLNDTMYGLQ